MTNPQAPRRAVAVSSVRRCATAAVTLTCAVTAGAAAPAAADLPPPPHRPALTARSGGPAATLTAAQRKVLVEATRRYRDADRALAAGYLATDVCTPGMGWHYAHPGLSADPAIDAVSPEVLLYVPGDGGKARLVGIEYFKADTDGDLSTDTDRPTLFGNRFDGPMAGHPMPAGAPPMPVHYDLHVWLYLDNPDGELAPENPRITCE